MQLFLTANNEELLKAGKLFEKLKGNDIHSALSFATAIFLVVVQKNLKEKMTIYIYQEFSG